MANLIKSIGYSIGKVHTGMINYLVEMYREGNKEPLESFFGNLGVKVPSVPISQREWNSVDLAILEGGDDDQEVPTILIEIKVDDYETFSSRKGYQTVRYASQWPSCQSYLFITLGKGEYYGPPQSDQFTWIRIRQFKEAIEAIKNKDQIISDWLEEVKREIELQDNVLTSNKNSAETYRSGTWNIYLFGHLAEALRPLFNQSRADVEMTCYTYGSRPDTIFHFGWSREPTYMEINYSGRLNLKMSLETSLSESVRREQVEREIQRCRSIPFSINPEFRASGKIGASKTIASFDVGLVDKDGYLACEPSLQTVKEKIFSVVNTFYGNTIVDPA